MQRVTFIPLYLLALTGICLIATPSRGEDKQPFKSSNDKIQYAIGVEVARNFKNQGMILDLDMVIKGMRDGLSGGQLLVSEKELRGILISVQSDIRRKQSLSKREAAGDKRP
ncbi:FKBP-type peptidyl-prolyl cis-trans isomerase N-terminal domain-containing protein [Geobacter sp. AOG2]|uniref:FKBP-type peptidyl-prolyl cis-trans isomerase N-terminal domain-containing protein n=1 Tax=Geobacter sp. AOG2 TaxID=1566347 RepID=UPI001CC61C11|nr:FKBP-type peptidyl-prolyl cis-trans isomerase N-terminal domain-containing protein [Geobacter sp. AOG2]GFE60418.1 hypothetical protein AOG2_10060 [Geobacter sp. AOG2]